MFCVALKQSAITLVILVGFLSNLVSSDPLTVGHPSVDTMGICTDTWRRRIGAFSQRRAEYCGLGIARHARVTPRFACVIVLLLILGGVEVNPGPGPK